MTEQAKAPFVYQTREWIAHIQHILRQHGSCAEVCDNGQAFCLREIDHVGYHGTEPISGASGSAQSEAPLPVSSSLSSSSLRTRILQAAGTPDLNGESSEEAIAISAAREALLAAKEQMRDKMHPTDAYVQSIRVLDELLADIGGS